MAELNVQPKKKTSLLPWLLLLLGLIALIWFFTRNKDKDVANKNTTADTTATTTTNREMLPLPHLQIGTGLILMLQLLPMMK